MATANELLGQWVSSFNESRWDRLREILGPNSVTEEFGPGRTAGPDQWVEFAQGWRAAFPDSQGAIHNRIEAGNQAIGEIVWTGTNGGSFMGMPPTNKPIEVHTIAVVVEEGGKISRVRHYMDMAGLMRQLGIMPPSR